MYKSPIDVMMADIQHQIVQKQDEEIYKAVVSVGINVDKDELIRALQYDRRQYDKGYADGTRDAEQKWIPVTERLPENDKWVLVCKKEIKTGMQIIAVDRCTLTVGGDRMWLADYTTWKQKVTHWMLLPEPPKGE